MDLEKIPLGKKYITFLKKIEYDLIIDLEGSADSFINDGEFMLHMNKKDIQFTGNFSDVPDLGCSSAFGDTYTISTHVENTLIIIFIFKTNLGFDVYTINLANIREDKETEFTTDFNKHAGHIFKAFVKLNELVKRRYKKQIESL